MRFHRNQFLAYSTAGVVDLGDNLSRRRIRARRLVLLIGQGSIDFLHEIYRDRTFEASAASTQPTASPSLTGEEALTTFGLIRQARKTVVVADSSKLA